MKIELLVEGQTERVLPGFLKQWLDPELSQPIRIDAVNLAGSGEYLGNFAKRAKRDLASGQFIAAIGLLDLYGAALRFPPHLTLDESILGER